MEDGGPVSNLTRPEGRGADTRREEEALQMQEDDLMEVTRGTEGLHDRARRALGTRHSMWEREQHMHVEGVRGVVEQIRALEAQRGKCQAMSARGDQEALAVDMRQYDERVMMGRGGMHRTALTRDA